MKVILISKVTNFGNIGDVVDVKNGYAKNFLIPQKKAISYTPTSYKIFEEQKKQFEAENQKIVANANEVKKKIANKDIIIIESASDDGRLYGSVNTNLIASQINKDLTKEQAISRKDVVLSQPIKETGVYTIKVDLHSDVAFNLRLVVSRNKSEVETLIKKSEKKGSAKENTDHKSLEDAIEVEESQEQEAVEEATAAEIDVSVEAEAK